MPSSIALSMTFKVLYVDLFQQLGDGDEGIG